MRNLFFTLCFIHALFAFAQQDGALLVGFGGGQFRDHQLNGIGISGAIKSPYIFKKQKVFLQLGASLFMAEGNRNFDYDPNSRQSISTINQPDFFNTQRINPDIWKPIGVKTSQSSQGSYELVVGKSFEVGKKNHVISLGGGVYRAIISQYYILESMNIYIDDNPFGAGGELLYHIPFSQKYRVINFVGNLNYLHKLSDRFFLLADAKYFHQAKPLSGNIFFTIGVGVSL